MKTLKTFPEAMTAIINIQLMSKSIDPNYDTVKNFKRMEKMEYDDLFKEQDELILKYNAHCKSKNI